MSNVEPINVIMKHCLVDWCFISRKNNQKHFT